MYTHIYNTYVHRFDQFQVYTRAYILGKLRIKETLGCKEAAKVSSWAYERAHVYMRVCT